MAEHNIVTFTNGERQYILSCESGATFDEQRQYRYSLWRRWDGTMELPMVAFCGLNPSTADEEVNDPTIKRCIKFAQREGFGGLVMLNLFALRETDPHAMLKHTRPVGKENDMAILQVSKACERVVCCWGKHGRHLFRSGYVMKMLPQNKTYHLGLNLDGTPKHPLYLKASTPMKQWAGITRPYA